VRAAAVRAVLARVASPALSIAARILLAGPLTTDLGVGAAAGRPVNTTIMTNLVGDEQSTARGTPLADPVSARRTAGLPRGRMLTS